MHLVDIDPGASGGLDLDSDLITSIAEDCPNTAGVKLTYVISSLPYSSPASLTRICDIQLRKRREAHTHM